MVSHEMTWDVVSRLIADTRAAYAEYAASVSAPESTRVRLREDLVASRNLALAALHELENRDKVSAQRDLTSGLVQSDLDYESGWERGDTRFARGYISRKSTPDQRAIHCGGGARRGQLYVDEPSWESTSYCRRQYYTRPRAWITETTP